MVNRKLVALIAVVVVGLGVYSATALKQQLLPDLAFPAVSVVAAYPGASPEVVENQVTVPLEDAVANLDGLESYTSTSQQGLSMLTLMFEFGTSTDDMSSAVSTAVAKVQNLPTTVDPEVATGSTSDLPTMTLAVTGGGDQNALAQKIQTDVVPVLQGLDGVNEVSISGTTDQVVTVTPDTAKATGAGLSTEQIATALQSMGTTSAAGSVSVSGQDVSVQVGTTVDAVRDIQNLWLTGTSGAVQLKDVAAVSSGDAEVTSITRTDGQPSLGLAITMAHNGSASSISDEVRAELPDLEKAVGASIVVVSDSGPQVHEAVLGLLEEGGLGLLMAVLVIVLFLRSARSTLVTAVSIPMSLLIALIVVWTRDYSLNMLTLGALTIAVGRIVDDSIVVLENIQRHLGYGEERKKAILDAVREVSAAVTSSTLTTVAVFLPIAFVGGLVGELFAPFAVTIAVAMLASLLVSLTIIPALAYWFLKTPEDASGVSAQEYRERVEAHEREGRLQRTYLKVITWAVNRRKRVLAGALVLLVATVGMAGALKTSFLGDSESTSITVTQQLPAGTDLETTDAAAAQVEKIVGGMDDVETYQVSMGSSGGGLFAAASGSSTASYTLTLAEGSDVAARQDDLRERLGALSDAGTFTVSGGDSLSSDIEVVVTGDDTVLTEATQQVQGALTGVTQVRDVRSDLSESAPQISIALKGAPAASAGVTDSTLTQVLTAAISGSTVSQVTVGGVSQDVVLRTSAKAPTSLAAIRALPIPTATGVVELGDVATVSSAQAPTERTRIDGERTVTVTATPVGDDTGAATTAVTKALDGLTLPDGASYELGGVSSDQAESFQALILAMVVAVALVFLVVVAVFRSIRQTMILLVSIPFAFVGGFFLLLVTNTPLGIASLIGILMLIGIVVTNAIVLVDLINQYRERGLPVAEAVIEGGLRRLRPILMTALATIFALIPMALGITGSGGFISKPLAVVVIGGLVSSTALTLVLIPVLYTMVESRRDPHRRVEPTPEKEKEPVGV
ncbi:efflux RND transporter permease subunit [Kineosporia succinea]|uniref:HAE1 family hydrophobic/amphiphilic exporter-1 n=1 Tax=Kineosporia succinea TaxID=84632 RepID=A0ABT9PBQ0_9ACTN|nr:efflux RND transporter permease subunit [Kineosporia succinea]MDP9830134.1 HAE1 family hydrophobic/amphiphilic exporter-1 [Kineosporia succinea]